MKTKTKLIATLMAMCLVITLGVFGILAVKTLNMSVGGNISFTADGVAFTVGQGKFYKTDKTTEYVNITSQSGKMQGFAMNTNTKLADVEDEIASWAGLELVLDSQGDAVLKFNIKNDMSDKVIYVSFDVTLGTNTNNNMNIIAPTSEEIGPTDNKNIEITFDILDDSINAGLTGFRVDLTISDTSGSENVKVSVDPMTGEVTGLTESKYTNVKYSLNSNTKTATVAKSADNISGEIVIMDKVYVGTQEYSITEIEDNAFNDCSNLTGNLVIPNGITIIGENSFRNCLNLNGNLILPETLTKIEKYAFYNNAFTGNLIIPDSVTTIEGGAFMNSSFTGTLTLPKNITILNEEIFSGGTNAFTGDLIIPNGVTSIGLRAFQSCTGFNGTLIIPSSVETILGNAFTMCSSLTSIICESITPPSLENTFVFFQTNDCPIYVPAGSVEAYKTATNWSSFASRIQAIVA